MKSIEQAAEEFAEKHRLGSTGYPPIQWFKAGVEFAQKWYSIEEGLPENKRTFLIKDADGDTFFLLVNSILRKKKKLFGLSKQGTHIGVILT